MTTQDRIDQWNKRLEKPADQPNWYAENRDKLEALASVCDATDVSPFALASFARALQMAKDAHENGRSVWEEALAQRPDTVDDFVLEAEAEWDEIAAAMEVLYGPNTATPS